METKGIETILGKGVMQPLRLGFIGAGIMVT
jgi:hypothetical protein